MPTIQSWPGKDLEEQLLLISSLMEGEFSIDLILDLTNAKATYVLDSFDRFIRDGLLKKCSPGVFCFIDKEKKSQLRKAIPLEQQKKSHKRIAELLMINDTDESNLPMAAKHLLQVVNDLEGCQLLRQAGEWYRNRGRSTKALECYSKAMLDLRTMTGTVADMIFIESAIGYSKDIKSINFMKELISYLQEALVRAERCRDKNLQTLVLIHLASGSYLERNIDAARKYLERGFDLAKNINDPDVESTVITGIILNYFYSGRYKDAIKAYETSEPLYTEKYPMHKLSLRTGIFMGIAYARSGQVSQGLGMLDGIRTHALKIKDYETAATAAANMGGVFILNDDYNSAIDLLLDTLSEPMVESEFSKWIILYHLAYCNFHKGDFEASKDYLIRCLSISHKQGYNMDNLPYYIEICLAIEHKEFPPIPEISPLEEILKAKDSNNIVIKGVAYRCLALIDNKNYTSQDRFDLLIQSQNLFDESGHQIQLAKTKVELGRFLLKEKKLEKARDCVTDAAKILYPINRTLVPNDLAHLIRDMQIEKDLLEEILKLSQEVAALRDTNEVVQHIFSAVNRITGAERGAIFLKSQSHESSLVKLWAAKNLTANDIAQPDFSSALDVIHQTVHSGEAIVQNLTFTPNDSPLREGKILSCICVPLMFRGKTIGVLYHDNRLFKSTFRKEDIKILTYFASQSAIALDNAKAYDKIRSLNKRLQDEKQYLEEQNLENLHTDNFVAVSPAIKRVLRMVKQVAQTEATVLILGETGVGKEMVARSIHQNSTRKDKPFIRVHCSAFSESLIPSELFGHERGAFTGAVKKRIGRFELANEGTLFLDEIGDIPMEVQIRLLRVLQTKEFERVGGRETLKSDFRLIVATNRNLEEAVADGRFRTDLYYRLNVFPIIVPPLRDRSEDIAPLASYFLWENSQKIGEIIQRHSGERNSQTKFIPLARQCT